MAITKLTSNGDGTGRIELVFDGLKIKKSKPGIYQLLSVDMRLNEALKCGDEVLRPKLVVRLYCRSNKSKHYLRMASQHREKKLQKHHAS